MVIRTAYRAEKFSELCTTCRAATDSRCFDCSKPVCAEHAHLRCLGCDAPAVTACLRCGYGVCSEHRPKSSERRCPSCEEALWALAASMSAGTAPARGADFGAIAGLLSGSILLVPTVPVVAGALAAGGFAWPALKMGYIAARRAAMVKQLRPDYLKDRHPSRSSCLDSRPLHLG